MLLMTAAPEKPPAAFVAPASLLSATPAPAYRPEERAVDNWRIESALTLRLSPLEALRRAADADDKFPARCVKLNNYWCVKRAGWNGEIAADADGHVAFASAEKAPRSQRCCCVATMSITSGAPPARSPSAGRPRNARADLRREAASRRRRFARGDGAVPPQRIVNMGLAPRGIENTLRARWLAAHGRGGVSTPTAEQAERERSYEEIRRRNAERIDAARRRVAAATSDGAFEGIPLDAGAINYGRWRRGAPGRQNNVGY